MIEFHIQGLSCRDWRLMGVEIVLWRLAYSFGMFFVVAPEGIMGLTGTINRILDFLQSDSLFYKNGVVWGCFGGARFRKKYDGQ